MKNAPPRLTLVAIDGVVQRPPPCEHDVDTSMLAAAGADDKEALTLTVMRMLCDAMARESLGPWEVAHATAERALGLVEGPMLVAGVTALLRAIRTERKRVFSYLSPECPNCSLRLTEEERLVVDMLQSSRDRDMPRLTRTIRELAGTMNAARIGSAADHLGLLLRTREHREKRSAVSDLQPTEVRSAESPAGQSDQEGVS